MKVKVHDFMDPDLGKAIPYGVYDVAKNLGCWSISAWADSTANRREIVAAQRRSGPPARGS